MLLKPNDNYDYLKINQVWIKHKDEDVLRKEIHLFDGNSIASVDLCSIGLLDFLENPEDLLHYLVQEIGNNIMLTDDFIFMLEYALEYDEMVYVDGIPIATEEYNDEFNSEDYYMDTSGEIWSTTRQ